MKKIFLFAGVGVVILGIIIIFWSDIKNLLGFNHDQQVLTYIPFKENKDDRWGLIDMNGKIIIANEWENEPSIAVEGIVRVKNKDGLYEFYTAEEKTKKIGDEYKTATLFYEGLAAVSKENSQVFYIDKKGSTVFELKEADNQPVEAAGSFAEGLACFQTDKGKWGFINKSGNVVIKPIYNKVLNFNEGLASVELNVYKDKDSLVQVVKRGFIDKNGREVIKLKSDILYSSISNGLIGYSDNNGTEWGFIDKNGEKKIKPSKDFKQIFPFKEGYASFYDGDKWGIINTSGEKVIRAKYDVTYYSNGFIFIRDKQKYGFLNSAGDEVIKPQYDEGTIPFFGKTTVAKDGNKYILIDQKGKQVGKTDFAEISNLKEFIASAIAPGNVASLAYNDYFNVESIAGAVISSVSQNKINNLSSGTGVKDAINMIRDLIKRYPKVQVAVNTNYNPRAYQARLDSLRQDSIMKAADTTKKVSGPKINMSEEFKGISFSNTFLVIPTCIINSNASFQGILYFNELVNKPIEVERNVGGYHYKETVGNKVNTSAKLTIITYSVSLSGKGVGKAKLIADDFKAKMEKGGYIISKENSNDTRYLFMNGNKVVVSQIEFGSNTVNFSIRFDL